MESETGSGTRRSNAYELFILAVVMVVGVGIIASLASILARVLIPTPDRAGDQPALTDIQRQLADLHLQLRVLRQGLVGDAHPDHDPG